MSVYTKKGANEMNDNFYQELYDLSVRRRQLIYDNEKVIAKAIHLTCQNGEINEIHGRQYFALNLKKGLRLHVGRTVIEYNPAIEAYYVQYRVIASDRHNDGVELAHVLARLYTNFETFKYGRDYEKDAKKRKPESEFHLVVSSIVENYREEFLIPGEWINVVNEAYLEVEIEEKMKRREQHSETLKNMKRTLSPRSPLVNKFFV